MKYLFSDTGAAALERTLAAPVLLAFDFDGTLAPIVDRPQDARMEETTRATLAALCAAAPVAIISGRGVADLRQRLGVAPKYLVGNHGLEGIPGNDERLAACRAACAGWHAQLTRLLADDAAAGVAMEDKTYSLTLHYRLAPDPQAAAGWLHGVLTALRPLPRVIGGKHVFNLMPEQASDKRQALQSLLRREGLESALYAGDDDTDEAIFAQAPPQWLTVRVEPSPLSGARFFLRRQEEMAVLLERIARTLS